ncbi:MAG: amidase, partial [Gammaproteobacteria bacterium]
MSTVWRYVLITFVLSGCGRESEPGSALMDLEAPVLAAELAAGHVTAEQATLAALERIAAIDDSGPTLNAIIEVNPEALAIARALDSQFERTGPSGPLHGLPVAIKANIDTADRMSTSAGSLALAGHHAAEDAALVAQLREAGAVIVAKTNLSEWANFRGQSSSSGWSSLGGQTKNPYALDRSPCGSSSGSAVAVAARMLPLAVGTETDGSIVCPAALNGVVGIKPTHGSVSAQGVIPVAASQDVAGPFARTVRGAALLLAAMQGTAETTKRFPELIEREDLSGVRIGVLRAYVGAGTVPALEAQYGEWLEMLEGAGAELADPVGLSLPAALRQAEVEVLLYEFKAGIDAYLARTNGSIASLAALIEFNEMNATQVMPHFGQERFEMAQLRDDLTDAAYRDAQAKRAELRDQLRSLFAQRDIDALVAPVSGPAWKIDWENGDTFAVSSSYVAAVSGYPSIAVPAGLADGLPVSIAFIGPPDSEGALV